MPRGDGRRPPEFRCSPIIRFRSAYLIHPFFSRLGLKDALTTGLRLPQRNNPWSTGDMILALLLLMVLGLERLVTTYVLTRNGFIQHLTGSTTCSKATALRHFFLRLTPRGSSPSSGASTTSRARRSLRTITSVASYSMSTPRWWSSRGTRSRPGTAPTGGSGAARHTIHWCVSREAAATAARRNSAPATPAPVREPWSCATPASPSCRRTCGGGHLW